MSEPKSPVEQALDLFVYAPVGIALTAAEELPKLIEKGRQRVTGQIGMARMMGQFAVAQGQKEAEKVVRQATERIADMTKPPAPPSRPPSSTTAAASPPAAPATPAAATPGPAVKPAEDAPAVTEVVATTGPSTNGSSAPRPPADLAIPGYDALSASQVVQRLAGLSPEELEQVRTYETASRGRKTILSRIAQLQADSA
ncbi:MAG: hypothetical protein QOE80_3710 [Actinomycetota bacterium]|jgi:hypothetical protein|nr:hypothetical protein [Actinomycetota bacterium]